MDTLTPCFGLSMQVRAKSVFRFCLVENLKLLMGHRSVSEKALGQAFPNTFPRNTWINKNFNVSIVKILLTEALINTSVFYISNPKRKHSKLKIRCSALDCSTISPRMKVRIFLVWFKHLLVK